jgi:hypothetical protein
MAEQAPAWAARYIGVPFIDLGRSLAGCDCGGLARIIYAERAQIEIPDNHAYDGTDAQDLPAIASVFDSYRESGDWTAMPFDPDAPRAVWPERELDIVEIRIRGLPTHIGVVLVPGIAVHTMKMRQDSVQLRYREPKHRHIILGFHRHRLLAAA